jgi:hypothetical protein
MKRQFTVAGVIAFVMVAATVAWGAGTNFKTGFETAYNVPVWPSYTAPPSNPSPPPKTCGTYPGSVYTVTALHLQTTTVQTGQHNAATVRLQSQAGGAPKGCANLIIQRADGQGSSQQLVARLENGVAKFNLPDNLEANDYTVEATYLPTNCSDYSAPQVGEQNLTVTGN